MAIEFGVLGPLSKETADDRNDGSPDSKINQFSNHNIKVDTVKCFSEIDSTQVVIVTWFIKSFLNKVKHIYEVVRSGTPFDIAELLGVQLR